MAVLSNEDKVLIRAVVREKGYGAKRLLKEFPNQGWKLSTLKKFLKKLRETGAIERRPGSGRPRTVRTEDAVRSVSDLLCSDEDCPGTSLSEREAANRLGLSRSSVRRIAKYDLGLKVFKRVGVTALSPAFRTKRADRARILLRRFTAARLAHICFSDEKLFHVSAPRNPQNDRVHSRAASKRDVPAKNLLRERERSRQSVMVSIGVTMNHKGSVIFVPPGVKINAVQYQRIILLPMLEEMRSKDPALIFQQDGAPAHTARSTTNLLNEQRIKFIEPSAWPPCSPDLNPLDYFVWSAMEQKVYRGEPIGNVEQLKARIQQAWEEIPQEIVRRAIKQWLRRLREVVSRNGDHIESFL